jgi:hypothetical protein
MEDLCDRQAGRQASKQAGKQAGQADKQPGRQSPHSATICTLVPFIQPYKIPSLSSPLSRVSNPNFAKQHTGAQIIQLYIKTVTSQVQIQLAQLLFYSL